MAVNVKKGAASGALRVEYGVVDDTGYLVGSTATAPTAGAQAGSGMAQLTGVKNFPFAPAEAQRNNVTGDDGPIAQFLYDPVELPSGQVEFAVFDMTFEALIRGMLVDDVGDMSIVAVGPESTTFEDMIMVVQGQAKSQASGSVGAGMYEGLIIARANLSSMSRNAFQERTEAAYLYTMIANKAEAYPWGEDITVGLGIGKADGFRFSSPWLRHMQRWTGNNTEDEFTLDATPGEASGNCVPVWVNGVLKTYTTDYTVIGTPLATIKFEAAAIPAASAKIVTFFGKA